MLAESLPIPPVNLTVDLQRPTECSPTALTNVKTRSFGSVLEPRYIIGTGSLDQ